MAKTMVIYESLFGNARAIASAIADGLREQGEVDLTDVGSAPSGFDAETQLLVVGGPNHQFGMTGPSSRRQAIRDFKATTSPEVGLREWLQQLTPCQSGTRVAVFDTRMDRGLLRRLDQTTRTAERKLRRLGYTPIVPAEHFFVQSVTGPLLDGEVERATQWGQTLAGHLSS